MLFVNFSLKNERNMEFREIRIFPNISEANAIYSLS
jgi:hypothetical protein